MYLCQNKYSWVSLYFIIIRQLNQRIVLLLTRNKEEAVVSTISLLLSFKLSQAIKMMPPIDLILL